MLRQVAILFTSLYLPFNGLKWIKLCNETSNVHHHVLQAETQETHWDEFPNVTLTFNCTNRPFGFYADQDFACRLYHFCDTYGRRINYMCVSGTAFIQRYGFCDKIHNFDCKEAIKWYFSQPYVNAPAPSGPFVLPGPVSIKLPWPILYTLHSRQFWEFSVV